MRECYKCKGALEIVRRKDHRTFDAVHVDIEGVRWSQCVVCGERVINMVDLGALEMATARALVAANALAPDTFKFVRKAMGIPAAELAALLGLRKEVILDRWEVDEQPGKAAWFMLGSLVGLSKEERVAALARMRAVAPPVITATIR